MIGRVYIMRSGPLVYIGSTTLPLKDRLRGHRNSKHTSSLALFQTGLPVTIELLEELEVAGKFDRKLREREQHYMNLHPDRVNRNHAVGLDKAVYNSRYYEKHKEQVLSRVVAYRKANKEKCKKYAAKYRAANKEKCNKYAAKYREKHREEINRKQNNTNKAKRFRRRKMLQRAFQALRICTATQEDDRRPSYII